MHPPAKLSQADREKEEDTHTRARAHTHTHTHTHTERERERERERESRGRNPPSTSSPLVMCKVGNRRCAAFATPPVGPPVIYLLPTTSMQMQTPIMILCHLQNQ